MTVTTILVVAKAPVSGQAKTRLCPPLSPLVAADLAAAALLDTLAAAAGALPLLAATRDGVRTRIVVAITGDLTLAARAEAISVAMGQCEVITQRGDGLAARLVAAHTDAGGLGPVLQIGMDTPQLTPMMLAGAIDALQPPGVDAVLGPANDGGWWALGLKSVEVAEVLADIPMSHPQTYDLTLAALRRIGLEVLSLPTLTDVDTYSDALHVAADAPDTRFAAAVHLLSTQDNRAATDSSSP
ncbi:glycosyltransferase A (GT-A) superfamily protein (DUF2064 family) [Nakamurella sp. UYEF19]|uniref:TIGR04282 family arsenosugar biosynthesis glycosyltransferase n=1 Tax=Nakamurella sp. UYEF19 TaxID=1756392 RepID=UPI003393B843